MHFKVKYAWFCFQTLAGVCDFSAYSFARCCVSVTHSTAVFFNTGFQYIITTNSLNKEIQAKDMSINLRKTV